MRFLVDASLSPAVARRLAEEGHDAVHVGDELPLSSADTVVPERAARTGRVLVAADTDFGTLLATRALAMPSLILFRRRTGRRPPDQAMLLLSHLPDVEDATGLLPSPRQPVQRAGTERHEGGSNPYCQGCIDAPVHVLAEVWWD